MIVIRLLLTSLSIWGLNSCIPNNKDLKSLTNQVVAAQDLQFSDTYSIKPLPIHSPFKLSTHLGRNIFKPSFVKDSAQGRHQTLESIPLPKLKWVGLLQEGAKKWALIEQPNKHIVPISYGDYLGSNHARVEKITSKKILLEALITKDGKKKKVQIVLNMDSRSMG